MRVIVKYGQYVFKYEVLLVDDEGNILKREPCDTALGVWWYRNTLPGRYIREQRRRRRQGNVLGEYEVNKKKQGGFFRKG